MTGSMYSMLSAGNYYEIAVVLYRIIKMLIVPESVEPDPENMTCINCEYYS